MAVDKLVDSAQLDSDLGDIAIAIRTKGGTSAQLTFPSGFISAIEAITTGITPTGTINITQSGNTDVTNYATANVASGSATTPATTITANPSISVNSSTGLITATVSGSQSVTPTVSSGYVTSGTSGTITVSGSNTSQLTTQSAQTITPTTTNQTIASGKYLTGTQTILGDANLLAENIKKDVVLFGITGTYEGGGSVNELIIYTNANCTNLWADSAHTTGLLEAYDYSYSNLYDAFDNADVIKVIGDGNKRHFVIYFNYKSADDDFIVVLSDLKTLKDIYI